MPKLSRLIVVVALAVGLVGAPEALGATYRVRATSSNRWNPDFRHILKGDRIVWRNPATLGRVHNVRSYGGNWNKAVTLLPGESTRKRFRRRGTFKYRCSIHSSLSNGRCNGMCGVVHVGRM